jgi:hypothetical protein
VYDTLLDTPAQLTAMRLVIVLGVELDLLPAQACECPYGRMQLRDEAGRMAIIISECPTRRLRHANVRFGNIATLMIRRSLPSGRLQLHYP